MTFVPHFRVTALGTLPGNEIFSYGFAMDSNSDIDMPGFFNTARQNAVWDNVRDHVVTHFQNSQISERARITMVKIASIGSDGLYNAAPIEKPVNNGVGLPGPSSVTAHPPNQVALAVTLHTAGDIGRVKGRFYLPMPSNSIAGDGRISEAERDVAESLAADLVNGVADLPGWDTLNGDLRVVVASQGRRRNEGTKENPVWVQVLGPQNHEVTAVSVGRVLDTIRRRRNKLTEFRGTPTAVDQS